VQVGVMLEPTATQPRTSGPWLRVALTLTGCVLVAQTLSVSVGVSVSSGLFISSTSGAPSVSAISTATLAAPGGVAVGNEQVDSLDVTWAASTSGFVEGYEVHRAVAPGGPYTLEHSVDAVTLGVIDAGLAPGTTYYYVVRAVAGSWVSVDSVEASGVTLP